MSRRTPDAAQSVTSAPEPLAADQSRRARRYLLQMGIRVVCFLLAVLLWQRVPFWVSLLLIVGAVVLPYIAVLFANAGRERQEAGPQAVLPPLLDAAGPPRADAPSQPRPAPARPGAPPAGAGPWESSPWPRRSPAADEAPHDADRTPGGPR